jgi:hypothetical protein
MVVSPHYFCGGILVDAFEQTGTLSVKPVKRLKARRRRAW